MLCSLESCNLWGQIIPKVWGCPFVNSWTISTATGAANMGTWNLHGNLRESSALNRAPGPSSLQVSLHVCLGPLQSISLDFMIHKCPEVSGYLCSPPTSSQHIHSCSLLQAHTPMSLASPNQSFRCGIQAWSFGLK